MKSLTTAEKCQTLFLLSFRKKQKKGKHWKIELKFSIIKFCWPGHCLFCVFKFQCDLYDN